MKVLFWSELFWPYVGGVEVLADGLLPALAERGHRFAVITSHGHMDLPDEDERHGAAVHRLPFRAALEGRDPGRLLEIRRRLARIREEFRPDLVHLFSIGTSLFFFDRSGLQGAASLLVTLHNEMIGTAARREGLLLRMLHGADAVSTCSDHLLELVRRTVPEVRSRSVAVVNGIAAPAREPAPLDFDRPVLLCLGRLSAEKGFDVALEAFAKVAEHDSRVALVLAGDGPQKGALEAHALRLGVLDRVEFRGMIAPAEVWEALDLATIVLVPSRHEGLGMSAVQAAIMGRPVVATHAGGLPEVVLDGKTGLLVEPEDPHALERAVLDLLGDPTGARELGRAARRHALDRFTLERCADEYDGLYRRTVTAPKV